MIKRDITETVYEYDKEGKLVKKTVTEKHEEEHPNTSLNHDDWWKNTQITCKDTNTTTTLCTGSNSASSLTSNCSIQG
jgi:hypothetical protein